MFLPEFLIVYCKEEKQEIFPCNVTNSIGTVYFPQIYTIERRGFLCFVSIFPVFYLWS